MLDFLPPVIDGRLLRHGVLVFGSIQHGKNKKIGCFSVCDATGRVERVLSCELVWICNHGARKHENLDGNCQVRGALAPL
jgi:hypothetical protein